MERAVELTTGNESQLTKLIQSGDVSRAVQLAKAAIVAVDEDKQVQPVNQELLKEKRKEVIHKFATLQLQSTKEMILCHLAQFLNCALNVLGMAMCCDWLKKTSPPGHLISWCKTAQGLRYRLYLHQALVVLRVLSLFAVVFYSF